MKPLHTEIIDQIVGLLVANASAKLVGKQAEELERLKNIFPFISGIESELSDPDFRSKLVSAWTAQQAEASLSSVKGKIELVELRSRKIRMLIKRMAAAAALVIGISCLFFFYWKNDRSIQPPAVSVAEIMPAKENVTITLPGGEILSIKGQKRKVIASAAGLQYGNGEVISAHNPSGDLTARTYRGNTAQIILPDGTEVWLNAASILKFPSTFDSRPVREVVLTGEAYFKVAHDRKHPFRVKSPNQTLTVLGTEFNLNAYEDEPADKTTLYQGSVRLENRVNQATLNPGEQALAGGNSSISISKANLESASSWRTDEFVFIDEPIGSIMRQLSRWYAVDVSFDSKVDRYYAFDGYISRNRPLSEILERLEQMGDLKFVLAGRKIIVKKSTK